MMELMVVHPHIFWLSLGGVAAGSRDAGRKWLFVVERRGSGDYRSGGLAGAAGLGVARGDVCRPDAARRPWLWWKWLSRRVREQKHSDSHLNQRGQQLIGRRFVLESPLVNGRGHMRVGDSSWPVSASEDLGAGTHVEVIAIEGITLIIRAVIA